MIRNLIKNEIKGISGAGYIEITVKNGEEGQTVPLVTFDKDITYQEQDKVLNEIILDALKDMSKKDTKRIIEYHNYG